MAYRNERYITNGMRKCARVTRVILATALAIQLLAITMSPEEVPIHWRFDGKADSYGPPWMALLLWGILAGVIALDAFITRSLDVEFWNTPPNLDEDRLESWRFFSMRVLFGTNLILSVIALTFALMYLLQAYEWAPFFAIALIIILFGYYIFEYAHWRKPVRKCP